MSSDENTITIFVPTEYKKFASRAEMLRKIPMKRALVTVLMSSLAIVLLFYLVRNIQAPIEIFYAGAIFIGITYVLAILRIKSVSRNYAFNFLHTYLTGHAIIHANLLAGVPCFIFFYSIFKGDIIDFLLIVFLLIIGNLAPIIATHGDMKRRFSSYYYKINGKIFFDIQEYSTPKNPIALPRFLIGLSISIAFITINSIASIISGPEELKATTTSFFIAAYLFLFSMLVVVLLYTWYIHKLVEKRFNQRLLSDNWVFFELEPKLAEEFLGSDPYDKQPIQYEEIFSSEDQRETSTPQVQEANQFTDNNINPTNKLENFINKTNQFHISINGTPTQFTQQPINNQEQNTNLLLWFFIAFMILGLLYYLIG